jgi:cardiolipin synthase
LAKVFGWAFAWWGIGLYWWAGVLYAYQVFKLMRTTERWRPGGRPGGQPSGQPNGQLDGQPGRHTDMPGEMGREVSGDA